MWSVIYSNYFPREVDSYWATKEEAEAQMNKLNDEDTTKSRMWEIEEVHLSRQAEGTQEEVER
jgi:Ser-tRNA(Ala) deacylase AlaX